MRPCAEVTPVWSADVDPRVLRVRCHAAGVGDLFGFDIRGHDARIALAPGCEHLGLIVGGKDLRMDIVEGTVLSGAVRIEPVLDLDRELEPQLLAVRRLDRLLRGLSWDRARDARLPRLVLALRALDALAAGISLRGIAAGILGARDWPGDGDCEKSRARRIVDLAKALRRAGPGGVLQRQV